nr:hypothetical protein [Butyrivibrio sp.]
MKLIDTFPTNTIKRGYQLHTCFVSTWAGENLGPRTTAVLITK